MEEKPVVASMSKEVILSIEDLQREGSKKLPTFKQGKSYPSFRFSSWWTKSDTEPSMSQVRVDHVGYFQSGCLLELWWYIQSQVSFKGYLEFWSIEMLARR
jgi:hypothetical protein